MDPVPGGQKHADPVPDPKRWFYFRIVGFLLDGLVRWDGHHFLHIATHGYTFETNLGKYQYFLF
jgi:hypothetical protein